MLWHDMEKTYSQEYSRASGGRMKAVRRSGTYAEKDHIRRMYAAADAEDAGARENPNIQEISAVQPAKGRLCAQAETLRKC